MFYNMLNFKEACTIMCISAI